MWPPSCSCKVAEFLADRAERQRRDEQVAIERFYSTFQAPERFQDRRLATFQADAGSREALATAQRFAGTMPQRLDAGDGIVFWGANGNGKTHLAAGLFHRARSINETAIFVTVPDLIKRIKATFDSNSAVSEHELTAPLMRARLLVLDDLGQERTSEWVTEKLFQVINHRYEARRSVIVTTNRNPDQLQERIGAAAMDRLTGLCRFVEITSESQRWREASGW